MKGPIVFIIAAVMALRMCSDAQALTFDDRYCGPAPRDITGRIIRSQATTRWFQRIHPCPVNGLTEGSCPDRFKDHTIPLACGGCDTVDNMQWLSGAAKRLKDSTERSSYRPDPRYPANLFPGCPGPPKP